MSPDSYNDPIRECQAKHQLIIDKVEALRPILKACEDALTRSGPASTISSVHVGKRNPMEPKVEIMLGCSSLNETLPLFRELAKEGLKTNKEDPFHDASIGGVIGLR